MIKYDFILGSYHPHLVHVSHRGFLDSSSVTGPSLPICSANQASSSSSSAGHADVIPGIFDGGEKKKQRQGCELEACTLNIIHHMTFSIKRCGISRWLHVWSGMFVCRHDLNVILDLCQNGLFVRITMMQKTWTWWKPVRVRIPPACSWFADVPLSRPPFDDVTDVLVASLWFLLRSISSSFVLLWMACVEFFVIGLCVCVGMWAVSVRLSTSGWQSGLSLAFASVAFCSVITVKSESISFFTLTSTFPLLQTDFTDIIVFILVPMATPLPLLWPSDWSLEKLSFFTGFVSFKLLSVRSNELTVFDFLELWDSWGGLISLFMEAERATSLFVFPPSSVIIFRTICTLERGLRQIGDSWPSFSSLTTSLMGLGLSWLASLKEEQDSVLIWLLGVSGTERRGSGEEGKRFSRSPRTLLFKGDWGLKARASACLMWGSVSAAAVPVLDNLMEDSQS